MNENVYYFNRENKQKKNLYTGYLFSITNRFDLKLMNHRFHCLITMIVHLHSLEYP